MSALVDRARSATGARRDLWIAGGVIALGALYPWYFETLQELPLIGDFIPSTGSMVVMREKNET